MIDTRHAITFRRKLRWSSAARHASVIGSLARPCYVTSRHDVNCRDKPTTTSTSVSPLGKHVVWPVINTNLQKLGNQNSRLLGCSTLIKASELCDYAWHAVITHFIGCTPLHDVRVALFCKTSALVSYIHRYRNYLKCAGYEQNFFFKINFKNILYQVHLYKVLLWLWSVEMN